MLFGCFRPQSDLNKDISDLQATPYSNLSLYARTILITDPPGLLFPRTLHSDKAAKQDLMVEPLDILDGWKLMDLLLFYMFHLDYEFFLTWADKLFLNADFFRLRLLLILKWRTLLLKSP